MQFRLLGARARARLRHYWSAQDGNIAITFALATIPIVGFVGAAVDYSRANSAKAAMQAATDSVALMLSKDAQKLNSTQLDNRGDSYFAALFNRTEVTNIVLTPTYTNPSPGSFKLDLVATGKVATTFTKVLGQQS